MTDLEENCWSEKVCQDCGSRLPDKPHVLSLEGMEKRYCSEFCYQHGVNQARLSAPVFVAPASMSLRHHLLARDPQFEM